MNIYSFYKERLLSVCLNSGVAVAVFKHHTGPVTSVEWHPTDSSVFVASGSDNQVTLWDLAVERDNETEGKGRHMDVPPQLLFIHMVCQLNLLVKREFSHLEWFKVCT